MPHLRQITLYPIKSLDGVSVAQATILASGALQHDREFAIADQQGTLVNGKRTAQIHRIRSDFDLSARTVTLWTDTVTPTTFELERDRPALAQWFSDYFQFPVQLLHNTEQGFPDDTASPGPTIVSTASLEAVTHWFPELSLEEARRRFRTNLELDAEPFWEERLYSTDEQVVPFQIGVAQFLGVNPCQRCVVPTRDTVTGAVYPGFQKQFATQRQISLPDWAERSHFNHFYRLAVNTRLPSSEAGKVLHVGDSVSVAAPVRSQQ